MSAPVNTPLPPTSAPPLPERRETLLSCLLIIMVGALVYAQTLHVPWFMDDYPNIVENPLLRDLGLAAGNLFAPRGIAYFTFALNYHFGGVDPVGYHLVSIGLHLANGLLVYLLLTRLFRQPKPWLARCGALLFVVHPLQTQAVNYTVQRMTSLGACFFLLALYAFVRARENLTAGTPLRAPRHLLWYGAALLAGALAVFTKENTAVLPLALLLFARYFPAGAARNWPRLLCYLAPFCLAPLVVGAQLLMTPLLAGQSLQEIGNAKLAGNGPLCYLFTEFKVLWIYLRLLVLPFGQALEYDYPLVNTLFNPASLLGLVGLCALGAFAVMRRHTWPLLSFAIAWFFLTLTVESSVIPLDPLFEHRLYLPLFALAVVISAGLREMKSQKLATAVGMVVLMVLAVLSWQRNTLWTDQISLFADNLNKVPHSRKVRENLSGSYLMAGQSEAASRVLQGSEAQNVLTAIQQAMIYMKQGQLDAAKEMLTKAIKIDASAVNIYLTLADLYVAQNNFAAALSSLSTGLRYNPENPFLYNRIGSVYLNSYLQPQTAIVYYRKAIALDSQASYAHFNLGLALNALGRLPESLAEYRNAIRLDPADARALQNGAEVALRLGDRTTATELAERLKAIDPARAALLNIGQ
jgi:protein O-mannosyl-transferase